MKQISLAVDSILTEIYATSALTTLHEECKTPLLHPDHADALRHTVADALHITLARAGTNLRLVSITDSTITLLVNPLVDTTESTLALRHILANTAIEVLRRASGQSPATLPSIDILAPQFVPTVTYPLRI